MDFRENQVVRFCFTAADDVSYCVLDVCFDLNQLVVAACINLENLCYYHDYRTRS